MRILKYIFAFILLLVLPFIGLIRGAVYAHQSYDWMALSSLGFGMLVSSTVLLIYFTVLYKLVYKKLGNVRSFKRRLFVALLVVMSYCTHALFFINGDNIKSPEIRSEYIDLHPILRLSVASWIHLDKGSVVTDAARSVHDYDKMGLPRNQRSLHLKQSDGYAYAIDLRTQNRPEWLNTLVAMYFRAMGLQTLRHVGTADHLHVSLQAR